MPVARITHVRTLENDAATTWISRWWPALYEADPRANAYQSPQWVTAWLHQLPSSSSPVVMTVADEGGLLAALPLARHRTGATHVISALTPYAEYNDLVGPGARRPHVAQALAAGLDQLLRDGGNPELANVPDHSALGHALDGRYTWEATRTRTAFVPLPLNWEALPGNLRRQHAKRERRIRAGHSITYARTRTTGELLHLQPELERLHAARWAPACDHDQPRPDWDAVLSELTDTTAFIATITIDGALAAAQLCLYRGTTCWSLRPAMDPGAARLAPGHLLLRRLIDDLTSHGFTGLDLGRTAETTGQTGYKEQYQPRWSTARSFAPARPPRPDAEQAGLAASST
ncbi:GNAT family N-acetyltransferase [Streptomyces sp. NPDC094031]|uniref:GNAT family N-acetyltransferase n=1 Tax=Streptomyces sp. NPDC094031 TaxID=3155307 RepID=UPI00332EEE58